MADPADPSGKPIGQAPPPTRQSWEGVSPDILADLRPGVAAMPTAIDPSDWAGAIPAAYGILPRLRIGANRWLNLAWLVPAGLLLLAVACLVAHGLRELPAVEAFVRRHPGTGYAHPLHTMLPPWLRIQHFLNLFLMTFIIRSGAQILADHPRLYWTRHSTPGKEWLRMQKEVPPTPLWTAKQDSLTLPGQLGLPGLRHSIGLARWWHLGTAMLWLANGALFYGLLFGTGEWRRVIPTSWEVFPDAISVALQYLSLRWPTDSGWGTYNALQILAYGLTIFVAAPAALLAGLGMSPALSTRFEVISRRLNIQTARSLHFLVLCWFLLFIVVHVTLVFATGAERNLNHMYAGTDAINGRGLAIFAASMVIVIVGWVAATPLTLRYPRWVQRIGYALLGPVERLFEHLDATPGSYTERDISPYFWHNGRYPETRAYRALLDEGFASYRLRIGGLVAHPQALSLADLRALPHHEQITQHFCIQGWSGIAKWGGVSMRTILDLVEPQPEARWVVFYSLGEGADGGVYYDAHPIEQMRYHLSMLAYDMNGQPLSYGHGAPLRLRNEVQLGFKQVKWIAAIDFVADFAAIGGGFGGYNEDHEFFGYRQPI